MNRLSPGFRWAALAAIVVLALFVLPALQLLEMVRSGRRISPVTIDHARRIASTVQRRVTPADLSGCATSTELFNRLLTAGDLPESRFDVPELRDHKRRTDGDGHLQPEENAYAVVAGLPGRLAGEAPLLLWDPGLRGSGAPPWLTVDAAGRPRILRKGEAGEWERAMAGGHGDVLPSVPGKQRLLRP